MRAGKLTISPIAIHIYDERPGGNAKQYTIESESLSVEVTTMLGDEIPSLADLQPAAGPVALPARARFTMGWWLAGIAAVLAAGFVSWRRRKRAAPSEPAMSPHELAWLEMEQLVERGWAETDVKQFYVELTGVVRRFIERSTGVHAPEQTTEEFLREIVDGAVFDSEDQGRLRDFLESADLVKFAAFQPAASDIEASFARAKEFIRLEPATEEVAA